MSRGHFPGALAPTSQGAKPGSCCAGHRAVKPWARTDATSCRNSTSRRAAAVWSRLASLVLAGAAAGSLGCASIGAIKLQGAYLMGEGSEHREIRGGVTFKLREQRVGKRKPVALAMSPAEPNCAGGGK